MINESTYNSEQELQDWTFENIQSFLPGSLLCNGFQITTSSGKNGVPDGFAFDFDNLQWYVIECELLKHGVWPHIAEQITRFVVALNNPETLRKVRNRIFEQIIENDQAEKVAKQLNTTKERLHQKIELFVEGNEPSLVIFIDDTNRDLNDMAQALDISTKIFRIKKFIVNGIPEYHCPDRNEPTVETEPSEKGNAEEYDVIELLGGGKVESTSGRFKCYRLENNDVVYIKKSKYHEKNNYYWYGVSPQNLENIEAYGIGYVVFVMGEFGFAKVPVDIVRQYLKITNTTKNDDGSIRHYHVIISHGPEPEMFWSNDRPKFSLSEYFQPFE